MTQLGKLLLIDGSLDGQLVDGLRARSWIVETASTGRMGIDAAMKGQPDVVVTALVIPDVQGLNYARTLRTCVEHDVLIVGITTDGEPPHAQARAAGFDDVLKKPVDLDALHAFLLARRPARVDASEARATTKMEKVKPS